MLSTATVEFGSSAAAKIPRRPCIDQLHRGLQIGGDGVGGSDQLGALDTGKTRDHQPKRVPTDRQLRRLIVHDAEIVELGAGVRTGAGDHDRDHGRGGYDGRPDEAAERPPSRLRWLEDHRAEPDRSKHQPSIPF
jgi:hypothetical protein